LNALTEVVVATLKIEKRVALKGLGFFKLRFKEAHKGRNPKTQEVPIMSITFHFRMHALFIC